LKPSETWTRPRFELGDGLKPTGHAGDAELLLDDDGIGEVDETATLDVIELELVIKMELDVPEGAD
jgi:hypothetical protein